MYIIILLLHKQNNSQSIYFEVLTIFIFCENTNVFLIENPFFNYNLLNR